MATIMTMPSETDVPRIYAWSHKEVVAFNTWCRNNQIFTLPVQDGWRIVNHLLFRLQHLLVLSSMVTGLNLASRGPM